MISCNQKSYELSPYIPLLKSHSRMAKQEQKNKLEMEGEVSHVWDLLFQNHATPNHGWSSWTTFHNSITMGCLDTCTMSLYNLYSSSSFLS